MKKNAVFICLNFYSVNMKKLSGSPTVGMVSTSIGIDATKTVKIKKQHEICNKGKTI